jgi:hypothetical protein
MEVVVWGVAIIFLLFGFVVVRGAPYVPSHRRFVKLAFTELYPLSDKDVLVDLGSGDGIVLRQASERGAVAIGYELNPILVFISRLLSRAHPNVRTEVADIWTKPLPPETTVVYAFSVSRDAKKLERKMLDAVKRSGKTIHLITYGAKLRTKQPAKMLNAQ